MNNRREIEMFSFFESNHRLSISHSSWFAIFFALFLYLFYFSFASLLILISFYFCNHFDFHVCSFRKIIAKKLLYFALFFINHDNVHAREFTHNLFDWRHSIEKITHYFDFDSYVTNVKNRFFVQWSLYAWIVVEIFTSFRKCNRAKQLCVLFISDIDEHF